MLKERIYYFIISLFFGLLVVYIINKPPIVIITHPDLNKISEVIFIDEDEDNLCNGIYPELVEC